MKLEETLAEDPFGVTAQWVPTALEVEFLRHLEADGYAKNTIHVYRSSLKRIGEITGRTAELANAQACTELFRAADSAASRRKRLALLRHLHEWLYRQGYPYSEDARHAELPRPKRPEPRPLPPQTIDKLRRTARRIDDLEWKAYFFVLDACGVRSSEPASLTVGDVQALLHRSRDRRLTLRFGQTKRGGWTFPLYDVILHGRPSAKDLVPIMAKYAQAERPVRFAAESDPFFIALNGRHRGTQWIQGKWSQHLELAGLSGIELGRLRHTFACEELERTRDLERVRIWLHHASASTTAHYAQYVGLEVPGGYR